MTDRLSDNFFEVLGEPKPERSFDLLDAYRFDLCYRQVGPGSVLDVGAYLGDFLKLAQKDKREIFGTEVNQDRVNLVNSILGSDVVRLNFRNGSLDQFESNTIDTVVCMETLEHVIYDRYAVSELCRVAKKRVVITVPFRENIPKVLCMHCDSYTPHHGHQHSYHAGSFSKMLPEGWQIVKEQDFAKRATRMVKKIIWKHPSSVSLLKISDMVTPGYGQWLLVTLEPID